MANTHKSDSLARFGNEENAKQNKRRRLPADYSLLCITSDNTIVLLS